MNDSAWLISFFNEKYVDYTQITRLIDIHPKHSFPYKVALLSRISSDCFVKPNTLPKERKIPAWFWKIQVGQLDAKLYNFIVSTLIWFLIGFN